MSTDSKPFKLSERTKDIYTRALRPKGATDAHVDWFFYVCEQLQLDPVLRQVHLVVRKQKTYDHDTGEARWTTFPSVQTGIDGLRILAERSGEYAGQDAPLFHYAISDDEGERIESGPVVPPKGRMVACTKTVYRAPGGDIDKRYGISATAYLSEYQQLKNNAPVKMWTKPGIMLPKCTESQALRTAFPHDTAGVYTDDEMAQADNEPDGEPESTEPAKETPKPESQQKEQRPQQASEPEKGPSAPEPKQDPAKKLEADAKKIMAAIRPHLSASDPQPGNFLKRFIAKVNGVDRYKDVSGEQAEKTIEVLLVMLDESGPEGFVAYMKKQMEEKKEEEAKNEKA